MDLLRDRAVIVTGGAQGIGLATVATFLREGARVVVADRDADACHRAAEGLGAGDRVVPVACDVTVAADVQAAVDRCVFEFGRLDVMVNNAGITRDATMRKMTEEQFEQVIAVHLKGCWNGTRLAAAVMREQHSGAIVNLSSISGKVGFVGQTNYSAAKAGIVGLTKAAAKEMAHHGVRVNAIAPGLIRSPMTEAMPRAHLGGEAGGDPDATGRRGRGGGVGGPLPRVRPRVLRHRHGHGGDRRPPHVSGRPGGAPLRGRREGRGQPVEAEADGAAQVREVGGAVAGHRHEGRLLGPGQPRAATLLAELDGDQ